MRHLLMRRILLFTLAVALLSVAPAAAQQEVSDTRGRVYTLIGGAVGDGQFIAAGAGAGIRLAPHLGLDLEFAHLADVGGADRPSLGYFSPGIPEGAVPFFGMDVFERPRQDVTTFLTKMVVEFPVADGRLFPYLAAGGGVGRVTARPGLGGGFMPWWLAADWIFNDSLPAPASGSDPGIDNADTADFFHHVTFPAFRRFLVTRTRSVARRRRRRSIVRGLGVGVDVRWLRVLLDYDHVDTAQVGLGVSYRF